MQKSVTNDIGLLFIRTLPAVVLIFHGSQKLFGWFGGYGLTATADWMGSQNIPFPMLSATLAGSAEFFGGLALLLGVAARIALVPMIFTMAVACTMHPGFDAGKGGMEYPLTLAVVLTGLLLTGPGRLTVAKLFRSSAAGRDLQAPEAALVPVEVRH